jgi:hypothetical protein
MLPDGTHIRVLLRRVRTIGMRRMWAYSRRRRAASSATLLSVGDTVNTAARLTGLAGPGEILVSAAAATAGGLETAGLDGGRWSYGEESSEWTRGLRDRRPNLPVPRSPSSEHPSRKIAAWPTTRNLRIAYAS